MQPTPPLPEETPPTVPSERTPRQQIMADASGKLHQFMAEYNPNEPMTPAELLTVAELMDTIGDFITEVIVHVQSSITP